MTASLRGQLGIAGVAGVAALLTAAAGPAAAAENLPALRVDPGLLGLTPAPAAAAATPATPTSPAATEAPATSVASSKTKPAEEAATAVITPAPQLMPLPAAETMPAEQSKSAASAPAAATKREKSKPAQAEQDSAQTAVRPAAPGQPGPTPVPQVATEAPAAPRPKATGVAATAQPHTPDQTSGTAAASGVQASTDTPGTATPSGGAIGFKKVPHDPNAKSPVYVTADSISGTTDQAIVAEGNVELQQEDATLTADKVTYWQVDEETEAEGNVVLTRPDARISGPKMRINLADSEGYADHPNYVIQREVLIRQPQPQDINIAKPLHPSMPDVTAPQRVTTTGSGKAERIDFEGEGQYRLHDATYSTCPAGNQDWYTEVADLNLDYDREVGHGEDAKLYFKGVPILYTPVMSFPLNNQRKTGLLPPTIGANSKIGFQYSQPFYWNIAPNMDATLYSRLMSKRGLQLGGELRYLDYNYSGNSRYEYLPNDTVTGTSRYAYSVLHTQNFGSGFTGSLNLNGVSDSTYFTDLSTRISSVSQVNLLRQGILNYSAGWWSSSLALERYQTLQIPDQPPVRVPYARLPRLTLKASRPDLPGGLAFNLQSEYVNFSHPTAVDGQRLSLYPQISLPLQNTAFFVTPKVGVYATSYSLRNQTPGQADSIDRTLPIFSVDSGVTFERDVQWRDSNLTQTLEPRLYYVYIPYRDQSNIPVFDTALADFNFAQIFSENRYVGRDRVGDANQLTAAVTSRLIDSDTGVELIRGTLGQRYYFSDQRVTLPDETARTSRRADILAAVTGLIAPKTYIDTGWQYNPRDGRTERLNAMARYQPELGKVLNAGYRYTRDLLGQVDISGQWPLGGGWSGMGRYNFSTKESRVIEAVAGLEYNGGCWAIRGLLQRLSTTAQTQTTSFFIQLELTGFSNIGSNPAEVLRRTIPGYSRNYGAPDTTDSSIGYY